MDPVRVLNVVARLSQSGGIPSVVRTILRLSDPTRVVHQVCQLRPLEGLNRSELIDSTPALEELHSLDLRGRWTRSPRSLLAAYRLLRIIEKTHPDVVHVHTGSSLVAWPSKLLAGDRTRWLLDMHEPLEARHSILTRRIVAAMVRHNVRCVTHSPPVTAAVEAELGIPRERIRTIPLGIDLERFGSSALTRSRWRGDFGVSDDVTLVVTVGRVSAMKGIGRLLDVAERTRAQGAEGLAFAVIGRVGDEDWVRTEIRARNLEGMVHLLGFVEDLSSALHAADIYFAPSTYEGFGLAVVEGMACGLPVVASAVGGLTYVVDHGVTGFLVDPDNTDEFAEHLVRLSATPDIRERIGHGARSRAYQNFGENAMVSAYEELYEEIANSKR